MKKFIQSTIRSRRSLLLIYLIFSLLSATAQKKVMKLDSDLKANSTPMEAKARGIGSVSKYQFGEYAIVSGKEGWTTTTTKGQLFSAKSEAKSKKKLSFVFVGHSTDTVFVNAAINTDLKEINTDDFPIFVGNGGEVLFGKGWRELRESTENYLAVFSIGADTTKWKMALLTRMGSEVDGGYQFTGLITNGIKPIEIRPVTEWDDGKKSTYNRIMGDLLIGYEFSVDGIVVGAVQASKDSFQKKLVWLRHDMDDQLKLVLAASSAALMVRLDTTGPD